METIPSHTYCPIQPPGVQAVGRLVLAGPYKVCSVNAYNLKESSR